MIGAWGLTYGEIQGLSALSYKGYGDEGYYILNNNSVWELAQIIEINSFRAAVIKGKAKTILSFSGSDDAGDWTEANFIEYLVGPQYSRQHAIGLARATQIRPDIVVGHSLGGGIATWVALNTSIPAATINPAPITELDARKFHGKKPKLVNFIVEGEAIDKYVRVFYFGEVKKVGSCGNNFITRHQLPNLTGYIQPRRLQG